MQQGSEIPAGANGTKLQMLAASVGYALIFTLILASARLDTGHAAARPGTPASDRAISAAR
jgi:hypothetical protein